MNCIQCGKCCKSRAIDITFSDILRWNAEERWDILSEVSYIKNYPHAGMGGLYIEKSLKKKSNMNRHCPFLTTDNKCSIHDSKPSGCSDAPLGYREFKECPVFEKPPAHIIDFIVCKQGADLRAVQRNQELITDILVKAREVG